jgi:hypothetical protein
MLSTKQWGTSPCVLLLENTAGAAGFEEVIRNIENPYEIKRRLDGLRGIALCKNKKESGKISLV